MIFLPLIAFFVFISDSTLLESNYLIANGEPNLRISNGNSTVELFAVPNGFSTSKNLLVYSKDPGKIIQNFNFVFAQTNAIMQEKFLFTYTDVTGEAFTFDLTILSSMDIYARMTTCEKTLFKINTQEQSVIQCNVKNSNVRLAASLTMTPLINPPSPWRVTPELPKISFFNLIRLNLSVQYIPFYLRRNETTAKVDILTMKFETKGSQLTYISLQQTQFEYSSCPRNCAECDVGQCRACQLGFSLVNGICSCSKFLIRNVDLISNSTIGNKSANDQLFLAIDDQCVNPSSIPESTMICVSEINSALLFGSTFIQLAPTFNSDSIIEAKLHSLTPKNLNYVSEECKQNTTIIYSSKLGRTDSEEDLRLMLSAESIFAFDQSVNLNFRDYYFCENKNLVQYNFLVRTCPVTMNTVFRSGTANSSVVEMNGSFIIVESLDWMIPLRKSFVPIFTPYRELQANVTEYLSAMICKDEDCYLNITSRNFSNLDLVYVTLSIRDPIFVVTQPSVSAYLAINNENRRSLLANFTKLQENVYQAVVSLDSTEIKNETLIAIKLKYNTSDLPQFYQRTEELVFSVFVPGLQINYIEDTFLNSIWFFWIVITGGVFLVCIILGSICYCCSKCMKKERFAEQDYYNTFAAPTSRFQMIEMVSKGNQSESEGGTVLSDQDRQRVNKIMQSLM